MAASLGLGGLSRALLAGAAVCVTSGCTTLGYYAQRRPATSTWCNGAAGGGVAGGPVDAAAAQARLELSQRIRDFAVTELGEPDNASYRRYADLKRGAAVWNVVAAPELSLELKTWCFPVVGCVGYRGYYDRAEAEAFAAGLLGQGGLDVSVYAVPAYSTLGKLPAADWLADPLLNTFIDYPEGDLARLIFHELAHQVAYRARRHHVQRILRHRGRADRPRALAGRPETPRRRLDYARSEARRADFRDLTSRYRDELLALYRSDAPERAARRQGGRDGPAARRLRGAEDRPWGGFAGYDRWFAEANNASFGVLASYTSLVPAFERLFEREGRDFARFYAEVSRLAALPAEQRRAALLP